MKSLILLVIGAIAVSADNALLREFTEGNTQFTAEVYNELKKAEPGNFLVCPLSVDIVLALAHAGARGNTAKQLSAGLHLPESPEKIQQIFRDLAPSLQNASDKYDLQSANKLYIKDSFQVSDQFKNVAVSSFNAEVQSIDFSKSQQSAGEINRWVEDKTKNKIKDLIKPDDLSVDTRAVLVNALYFHGIWVKKFEKSATRPRPFFLDNKNKVDVNMMEIVDDFNYYEDTELNAKFLEMPYKGGDVSMTFVLPNDKEGLPQLEAKLAKALVTPQYSSERVHVVVPKFKIESTIQFVPILQKLGVTDAFDDHADFSGIGANKESLVISKIVQKAFIEVEEEGTTAAAATAADFVPLSIGPGIPRRFPANRPFVYYIKYRNSILFVGRYKKPIRSDNNDYYNPSNSQLLPEDFRVFHFSRH